MQPSAEPNSLPSPRQKLVTGTLLAIVIIVAVWETTAALWRKGSAPPQADWQAAAATIRAQFQSGDLISIAPRWADQLGRAELGDLMPLEMVGRPDGRRYARIWELSIRGAKSEDSAGLLAAWTQRFGRVELNRYQQKPVEVALDLIERYSAAHVQGQVERRTLEIDYRPRYGLSIDVSNHPAVLIWDDIPDSLWRGRQLVLWFGLHDYYARKNARGPAEVIVDLDDGAVRLPLQVPLEDGLQKAVLMLPNGRAEHRIRLEVSAASAPNHLVGFIGRIEKQP